MITSAKNYTKKKKKVYRQTPRTYVKAKLYRQKTHKEACTETLTKREKGNIYMSMKRKYVYIYKKEE